MTIVVVLLFSSAPSVCSDHQERIRHYLGYQPFDERTQDQLARWLEARATEGALPTDLLHHAERQLRSWSIVLPAASTLDRLVASVTARAQQEIFARIANDLPLEFRQALDGLLQVAPGDHRSTLFRLKEYPPAASAAALCTYMARYQLVHELVSDQLDLGQHSPELVHHLALLAKRYDVQALKRFAPAKRQAMLACFLAETEKTLLDHLVEMHDQYMTTMCRRARHAFEERHRQFRRRAKEGLDLVLTAMDILLDPDPTFLLPTSHSRAAQVLEIIKGRCFCVLNDFRYLKRCG